MAASTLLEALTAELLGDVTALTQQVNQLKILLPSICEEAAIAASRQLQIHVEKVIHDCDASGLGESQLVRFLAVERQARQRFEEHATRLGAQQSKLVRHAMWETAHEVLHQMRREATRRVSMRRQCQWVAAMVIVLLIAMAAGFSLGATYKAAGKYSLRTDVLKDKPPTLTDAADGTLPKPNTGRSTHGLKKP